jgi:hypothetical protein
MNAKHPATIVRLIAAKIMCIIQTGHGRWKKSRDVPVETGRNRKSPAGEDGAKFWRMLGQRRYPSAPAKLRVGFFASVVTGMFQFTERGQHRQPRR